MAVPLKWHFLSIASSVQSDLPISHPIVDRPMSGPSDPSLYHIKFQIQFFYFIV